MIIWVKMNTPRTADKKLLVWVSGATENTLENGLMGDNMQLAVARPSYDVTGGPSKRQYL
jgi:hypothetical protein